VDAAKAIRLGHPSYVWRRGQARRLALIRRHVELDGRRILDVGCGIGTYVRRFRDYSDEVYGVDIDPERVAIATRDLPNIQLAPAERLPFADGSFDVVLLHEVIEHVEDDRAAIREAVRCTRVGGHVVVYAPNRLYPFETHGIYIGETYLFGIFPFVNYLPDPLRNRLAPHVRIYTGRQLRALFAGLPVELTVRSHIMPGFDNVAARAPRLGRCIQALAEAMEHTPLRAFGISHFVVARKLPSEVPLSPAWRRSGAGVQVSGGGRW